MKEYRRSKRKNMAGDVKIFTNGGTYLGGLRDISEGGISVATSTPYEVGYEMFVLADQVPAIEKTCFSSCAASGMDKHLNDPTRQQIILTGMEAHICVLQTTMQLLEQGKQVFVVEDGVCSREKRHFNNALARMRDAGAIITNRESVLFEWLGDASHPQFRDLSRLIR